LVQLISAGPEKQSTLDYVDISKEKLVSIPQVFIEYVKER